MEGWQIGLLLLAFIIVGTLLGVLISYIILRFVQKRETTFLSALTFRPARRFEASSAIKEWPDLVASFTFDEDKKEEPSITTPLTNKEKPSPAVPLVIKEKSNMTPLVVQELPSLKISSLLDEVQHNYQLVTQPLRDKLQSLETHAWDEHLYDLDSLPNDIRDDLEQVYIDIRLANSLVWLATEFGRRTPDLEKNYLKLCASIAERLDRIIRHMDAHSNNSW